MSQYWIVETARLQGNHYESHHVQWWATCTTRQEAADQAFAQRQRKHSVVVRISRWTCDDYVCRLTLHHSYATRNCASGEREETEGLWVRSWRRLSGSARCAEPSGEWRDIFGTSAHNTHDLGELLVVNRD